MTAKDRYPFADVLRQCATLLGVAPQRVLRRAGLPGDALAAPGAGLTASQWFKLWSALFQEHGAPDAPLILGQALAHGPFVAPIFAFSCSPTIETGLDRLSLFKPLVGPLTLQVARQEDALVITMAPSVPDVDVSYQCCQFEAVYFLECCRIFTGTHIVPLVISAPGMPADWAPVAEYLGAPIEASATFHMTLSLADATRPLITQNDEIWASFEPSLRKQLLDRSAPVQMQARVRNALLEALPSGQSNVDDICNRLHLSRRTLQRKLREEGTSFQKLLDATREELSLHYLQDRALSVIEISYLLGFQDPGSFYRAFQGWTGRTPADMRRDLLN